jgi:dienelactone hydrolase
MKKLLSFVSVIALFAATPACAALVTKDITYKDGGFTLIGHYAYDDAVKTPMPGVIVVPEWWGDNDYAHHRADQLEATALSKPFYDDRALMVRRAEAGLQTLEAQPQVDKTRVGAIGYCFGGAVALALARNGDDLKGVVSFHGNLATPTPAQKGQVKAEVLALNGADDQFVKPDERAAFAKEMTAAGVTYKSIDYPGATHAFTNPDATALGQKFNLPIAYNQEADQKSWDEMKAFFARLFATK